MAVGWFVICSTFLFTLESMIVSTTGALMDCSSEIILFVSLLDSVDFTF